MKITLSKKQWELIGNRTGWNKIAQSTAGKNDFTPIQVEYPKLMNAVNRMVEYNKLLRQGCDRYISEVKQEIESNDVLSLKIRVAKFWGDYSGDYQRVRNEGNIKSPEKVERS